MGLKEVSYFIIMVDCFVVILVFFLFGSKEGYVWKLFVYLILFMRFGDCKCYELYNLYFLNYIVFLIKKCCIIRFVVLKKFNMLNW